MTAATLITSAMFALISAAVYFYVGFVFSARPTSEADRRAARMFVIWWYGLAVTTVVGAIQSLVAVAGFTSLALFTAFNQITLAAVIVALMGLLYYLVYLFTGKDVFWGLVAFYIASYVTLVYYIEERVPRGVNIERWVVELDYAKPPSGPFFVLIVLLILLPQILGALAYFTLFFRVTNPTQRYRIALVSWSIIVWFGTSLVAAFAGLSAVDWWQVMSRTISLAASFVILMAYLPPAWVQRKFNIESIRGETRST